MSVAEAAGLIGKTAQWTPGNGLAFAVVIKDIKVRVKRMVNSIYLPSPLLSTAISLSTLLIASLYPIQ